MRSFRAPYRCSRRQRIAKSNYGNFLPGGKLLSETFQRRPIFNKLRGNDGFWIRFYISPGVCLFAKLKVFFGFFKVFCKPYLIDNI